jgi:hypothetical protein
MAYTSLPVRSKRSTTRVVFMVIMTSPTGFVAEQAVDKVLKKHLH